MFSEAINNFLLKNNYPELRIKAVFFDMDGVLFDSMKHHATAWVRALHDVGLTFTREEAFMNEGRTGHSTINEIFNRVYGRDATEDEKHKIYKLKSDYFDECGPTERMPYALDLLQKIKDYGSKIFVVTGSGQPSLIDNLQHFFPDIFEKGKMVTAFDVKHGKPHPEPYLIALDKSGVQPWEAVVVEHAPLGVASASAARLFTIGVNTGPLEAKVLSENGADIVLDSMQELFNRWDDFYHLAKAEN